MTCHADPAGGFALDTPLPTTDSTIPKRGSVIAQGDQQQTLLDVWKQQGKAFDRSCCDQATGCTNQQLASELWHGVSINCEVGVQNKKGSTVGAFEQGDVCVSQFVTEYTLNSVLASDQDKRNSSSAE